MTLVGLNAGCKSKQRDFDLLSKWMTGTCSSSEQHQVDPENYFEIRLHISRIWPERRDGRWFYVEQAMTASADRPYRQRIYRLTMGRNATFESDIHELPGDPLQYAGAWRSPALLDGLSVDAPIPRPGRKVVLKRTPEGAFRGSTIDDGCKSDFRGAAYVTSKAVILADRLVAWDRGYDAEGKQTWARPMVDTFSNGSPPRNSPSDLENRQTNRGT
ncbi:MAG: chromophore lyase CpcT/CpeT [Phycisphaerae bacterium]|nr:chromophore lyase CpcT/CpeT [Phycisphaerae bacterium]